MQGKDFKVKQTPAGASLTLNTRWKHVLNSPYKSDFEPSAPYASGDIVRVQHDEDYTSRDGTLLTGVSPGTWVCVQTIPPDIDPSSVSNLPSNVQPYYTRNAGVNYYPQWPEPYGGFRYWELLGTLPIQISFCADGVETAGWIGWIPISGNNSPS